MKPQRIDPRYAPALITQYLDAVERSIIRLAESVEAS
jgi:hypothetical protein